MSTKLAQPAVGSTPFPVYLMEKDVELPTEGTFYVIAKDRFYLHKDTGLFKCLVEVDKVSFLTHPEPYVELNLPKLPPDIIHRAHRFFANVFKTYKAEAAVVIHYNSETKTYYLHCPQQIVWSCVQYNLEDRFENYQLVGTIHSHCDFDAYHSATDVHDEEDQDGLHITLGHVNSRNFSASASLVINGQRFDVALENAALGVAPVTRTDAVQNKLVSLERQNRYRVNLTEEQTAEIDKNYPGEVESWMPNVQPKKN